MQPFHESDTGRCIWAYLNPVVTPTCRGSVFVLACRHGTGGTRCKEFKSWTLDIVFGPSLLFVTWTRSLWRIVRALQTGLFSLLASLGLQASYRPFHTTDDHW